MTFERAEYAARVARLRDELAQRRLDAALLDECEALDYFAGYYTSSAYYRACVVPLAAEPFYVLRALDIPPLRERSWIADVIGHADWEPAPEVVAREIKSHGLGRARIGIDFQSHGLPVAVFEALKAALSEVEFVDLAGLPWHLRKRKSPAEIERLKAAAEICDRTTQLLVETAEPGMTELELARVATDVMVRMGADPGGLPGVVTAGRGWDMLHGHHHKEPMRAGDILHIELLPRVDGYSARMMRDCVIGPIPPELQRASDIMVGLQDRQFAAFKPGAKASDLDRIVRQGMLDAGLRETYHNITGYTLGAYPDFLARWSDFTWVLHPKADWIVEEGMAFHVYTSARGLGMSESVVVRADGIERLTRLERRLFSTATRR
jgi:Xaa-Pro dipeptidase